MNARVMAQHLVEDLKLGGTAREVITDRLEVALLEAAARGRRLARGSMKTRRRRSREVA